MQVQLLSSPLTDMAQHPVVPMATKKEAGPAAGISPVPSGTATPETVLVLDFGSQTAQLIARRVRELIAQLGPAALETMACVFSVAMLVVILGSSLGMATEIVVGRQVGTGELDEADRTLLRALRRGFLVVCVAVVPLSFAGPVLLRWLNPKPACAG